MSRTAPTNTATIVGGGSFRRELVADVMYGSERLIQDVPIDSWSIEQDLDGEVKTSGSVTIAYQGDFAETISPRELTDALAPLGQELHLYCIVAAGDQSARIPIGKLRIDEVPSATDSKMQFQDRLINVGSVVDLSLLDRFHGVRRAKFRTLEQTPSLTSAWDEIRRLTGMQITRNVADAAIPNTVVYGRSRLDATQQIASVLGGRAYVTADGSISIIPDTPGDPEFDLTIGEEGTVLDVDYSFSSDDIYNVVVGDFETDSGTPIHAEAAILSGPLSALGPYGENVIEYPADQAKFIKTQSAADTAVAAFLTLVSNTTTFDLPIQCIFDPRLEIGDVVTVARTDLTYTGRIRTASWGRTGPMSLTLEVLSVTTS